MVLNFSGKDWNEPVSLSGLVRENNPYRNYMVDHTIKVIDIHSLTPEDCKVFTSDFGPLVNFLNSTSRSFEGMERKLDHPLEVLDMLNAYKGVDNYRKVRNNILMSSMKGESISMGTLLDDIKREEVVESAEENLRLGMTQETVIQFINMMECYFSCKSLLSEYLYILSRIKINSIKIYHFLLCLRYTEYLAGVIMRRKVRT